MQNESTTLYFRQGSADKEYHVFLRETDSQKATVTFAYGRRGGTMKHGIKTKVPVDFKKAQDIYARLVHAKKLKGYTISESDEAYSDSNMGEQTKFIPQLANAVTYNGMLAFYRQNEGNVCVQIKHDGERRGIILNSDIRATNRRGQEVPLRATIMEELKLLKEYIKDPVTLDTEDMGDHLVIFDNIVEGEDVPFGTRLMQLFVIDKVIAERGFQHLKVDYGHWPETDLELTQIVEDAKRANEEGVILRQGNALYKPGRPNSGGDLLKFKFVESATVAVIAHTIDKRSITIGVREVGTPAYRDVGKVSIPPNHEVPGIGAFVEVEYLYAYPEGCLFLPVYRGQRRDKVAADMHNSLKFKKGL